MTPSDATSPVNPFFREWTTPFTIPPFETIAPDHFKPAFDRALSEQLDEIGAIAGSGEAATFANTIEALERSGALLKRVGGVFFNLSGAHTNEALQAVEREMAPLLAKHRSAIYMNRGALPPGRGAPRAEGRAGPHARTDPRPRPLSHDLRPRGRPPGGGGQDAPRRHHRAARHARHAVLPERARGRDPPISSCSTARRISPGLPSFLRDAAAGGGRGARPCGQARHHPVALQHRALPEVLDPPGPARAGLQGLGLAGAMRGATDNKGIIAEMVALRAERARLLGYADLRGLQARRTRWRRRTAAVQGLLDEVWTPGPRTSHGGARRPAGAGAGRGRHHRHRAVGLALSMPRRSARPPQTSTRRDQAVLPARPHHRRGVRDRARLVRPELRGTRRRPALPSRHPRLAGHGTQTARVVGLFIGDYFARSSKRSGAWMSGFRSQEKLDRRHPADHRQRDELREGPSPPLLSFDDARTLFHEFGHALHGLLSNVTYPLLAGTARLHRFRRTAVAALRALAVAARDPAHLRDALPDRRADPGGPARHA